MPIRNARVSLSSGDATTTDAGGAFRFQGLEPGEYFVSAGKTGFTGAEERSVSLRTSQDGFVIPLPPLASIRGRVTDQDGEPVSGVTIQAFEAGASSEHPRGEIVGNGMTDDRGEFRIPLLPAGKYLVLVSGQASQHVYYGPGKPVHGTQEAFAPVYFGGSRDASGAMAVELRAGIDARADISVTMWAGHTISGRITNLVPGRVADLQLCSSDTDTGDNRNSVELASGRFDITGVLDGRYRLRAWQRSNDNEVLYGDQEVVVSGHDVQGIALTLGAGSTLKGKVRVEGPQDGSKLQVMASLRAQTGFPGAFQDLSQRAASSVAGETIEIPGVIPGRYWIVFDVGGGAYVSAARAGETDVLATGEFVFENGAAPELDIVLRTDSGQVSGTVAPPDAEAAILLIPDSCNRPPSWGIAQAGAFTVAAVAPGSYRIYAWKQPAKMDFTSHRAMCQLAQGGMPVEVRAGEVAKVQIPKFSEEPK
jgi:Carboxypeptidase regulatory-like domain